MLPRTFDYVATRRSHPKEHFTKVFSVYPADHSETCAGPNPNVSPPAQHNVRTSNKSSGAKPDESFFICKNHMMSSMGDVEGYSVSATWPRQEFKFANNNAEDGEGILEFEVNMNLGHTARSWWEVLITPRDQLKVGAAGPFFPIDETYPEDHIVLEFLQHKGRIRVGTGQLAPDGWILDESQWWQWPFMYRPNDPVLLDRRIRRPMRIQLVDDSIIWGIQKEDGSFDDWQVAVPGGFRFDQGLVLFKTHAYTPNKDGNVDTFTFHWDNVRFDGPGVGKYNVYEADDVVYLQNNGNRPIGDQQEVTIKLPSELGSGDPVLFGQVHSPVIGQVLLSINGGDNVEVTPYDYDRNDCYSSGWKSFRLVLQASQLVIGGTNTFRWTGGPRPTCVQEWAWDGFSIKFLQIQLSE